MEFWDELDINRVKTGKILQRGLPLNEGSYHLVVDIWIKNSEGQYLIAQRAPEKTHPNKWAATGGSAIVGEGSLEASLRETYEELGLDLGLIEGHCVINLRRDDGPNRCFKDVWLYHGDIDLETLTLQAEEVSAVRWVSEDEIWSMISEGTFVDNLEYLKELFSIDLFD